VFCRLVIVLFSFNWLQSRVLLHNQITESQDSIYRFCTSCLIFLSSNNTLINNLTIFSFTQTVVILDISKLHCRKDRIHRTREMLDLFNALCFCSNFTCVFLLKYPTKLLKMSYIWIWCCISLFLLSWHYWIFHGFNW